MNGADSVYQRGRISSSGPRQSRGGSLLESAVNVVFGFLLAFVMQGLIYPLLGINTTAQDNLLIAAILTLLSLIRSYLVRRAFETMGTD